MAEAIGAASGLLTLAGFAFKSSVALCEAIQSFKSHQQRVRDLVSELNDLSGVLGSLGDFLKTDTTLSMPMLELPLQRCGKICNEFEKELMRCHSRSGVERTSFRDWARMRYMDEDIDGFRRTLASYKMTISIALADANLRKSSAAAENIEAYVEVLNIAQADLEDRLERMDEKLEQLLTRSATEAGSNLSEVRTAREERLSTENCLQICAQLSEHISKIQLATGRSKSDIGSDADDHDGIPERITMEGLQQCKDDLARTAMNLAGHERRLLDRLVDESIRTATSERDRIDLARVREEWEATRKGMDICSQAHEYLKQNGSIIDNYATGDAVQFMVSTNEKTIYGKNRGLGWRTRQVGGHMSNEALRDITRTLSGIVAPTPGTPSSPTPDRAPTFDSAAIDGKSKHSAKFKDQYGEGFKLVSESDGPSSLGAKDPSKDRPSASRKK